jgi:NAD(P)-dependent dehydrogenase (short-subunit alcohol dehydrogenase family)
MSQTLVLIGSGPGIGVSVASLFAARKFDTIALISRSQSRLQDDRSIVLKAAEKAGRKVDVKLFAVDITSSEYEKTLDEVAKLGGVSCVVFNPARVGANTLFELGEEQMIKDFQVSSCPARSEKF